MAFRLRKFTPLLLGILLINLLGFYGYFFVRLHEIHESSRAALQRLPKNELTHFVFTNSEFKNVKIDDHEIQVNGNMYDIAFTENNSGKVHVYARHDVAEDNLLAFMQTIVNRIDHDNQKPEISFIQYLSLIFTAPEFADIPENNFELIVNHRQQKIPSYIVFLNGVLHPPASLI